MKKLNKKGFTLAELLIVVAIIAVLVAIAIPVFNNQLAKARARTDLANLRSAYAEATVKLLDEYDGVCPTDGIPVEGVRFVGTSSDHTSSIVGTETYPGGITTVSWKDTKGTYTVTFNNVQSSGFTSATIG